MMNFNCNLEIEVQFWGKKRTLLGLKREKYLDKTLGKLRKL